MPLAAQPTSQSGRHGRCGREEGGIDANTGSALLQSDALRSLDVSANPLGASGGASIADALRSAAAASLEVLDLSECELGDSGAQAIASSLRAGGAQVWITGTELAPFEAIADEAAVWAVAEGSVERR